MVKQRFSKITIFRLEMEQFFLETYYNSMGVASVKSLCLNHGQFITPNHTQLIKSFWERVQTSNNALLYNYPAQKLQDMQKEFEEICNNSLEKAILHLQTPPNHILFYRFERYLYGGQMINDLFENKGIIMYANNKSYTGQFKNGKYAGKGQFVFIRDNTFQKFEVRIETTREQDCSISGSVEIAKKKGITFKLRESQLGRVQHKYVKYANGDEYVGQWKDGFPDGLGKYIYRNGKENSGFPYYQGRFVKGQREGRGTLYYDSTKNLRISWTEDRPQGEGELIIGDFRERVNYEDGVRVYKMESEISQ